MKWRFIHIPRTGGMSFIDQYGVGSQPEVDHHMPASYFTDEDLLKFAVFRNPFSRAVSIYTYMHRTREPTEKGFREWARAGCPATGHLGLGSDLTVASPQFMWIDDTTTLISYEYYDDGMKALLPRLGLEYKPWKPTNSFRTGSWLDWYDADSFQAIREIYSGDVGLM